MVSPRADCRFGYADQVIKNNSNIKRKENKAVVMREFVPQPSF